jgi:hypothetical protein
VRLLSIHNDGGDDTSAAEEEVARGTEVLKENVLTAAVDVEEVVEGEEGAVEEEDVVEAEEDLMVAGVGRARRTASRHKELTPGPFGALHDGSKRNTDGFVVWLWKGIVRDLRIAETSTHGIAGGL